MLKGFGITQGKNGNAAQGPWRINDAREKQVNFGFLFTKILDTETTKYYAYPMIINIINSRICDYSDSLELWKGWAIVASVEYLEGEIG